MEELKHLSHMTENWTNPIIWMGYGIYFITIPISIGSSRFIFAEIDCN